MVKSDLYDRPIAFQRIFVQLTGSITGALLLSQACYWQKRTTSEDGWWWKTQKDWQDETGMTRFELETARKACAKFLQHDRRGVPCKSFYKVDFDALDASISLEIEGNSSLLESSKLDCGKVANKVARNKQSTNKTETTSDIKRLVTIPEEFRTSEFLDVWAAWYEDRRQRRKPITDRAAQLQLQKLQKWGVKKAITAIEQSIERGYTGIFEPQEQRNGQRRYQESGNF